MPFVLLCPRSLLPPSANITSVSQTRKVSPQESSALPEIKIAGFLNAALGLGETGRLIARALESVDVPVVTHVYEKSDVAQIPFASGEGGGGQQSSHPGISLLSLNGEHLSGLSRSAGGSSLFDNRYVISVWFWETEELPPHAADGFKYVDEVWAGSPFIKELMEKASGGVPVELYNHPICPITVDEAKARERFPFDGRFVFLFTFDYNSCVKRKNPQAVCEAFAKAFPEPTEGGPICIIKSINGEKHSVDFNLVKWKWAGRPDIVFLDAFLSSEDRNMLVMRSDACVSLHRSEGLGLTLLEAMAAGKPCIATAYSGNLAFMNDDRSWLIPYTKVPVGSGSVHYPAHHEWAEPDVDAAAAAMRDVFYNQTASKEKAERGRQHVLAHHSLPVVGRHMYELLKQSATRPVRKKEIEAKEPSGRGEAYKALAELRELEAQLAKSSGLPSTWRRTMSHLKSDTLKLSKLQRRAISNALRALKHSEDQQRERIDYLHAAVNRISRQFEQLMSQIKL